MGGQVIDDELRQELAGIAGSVECELHHVRFANDRLQIFLDRPDGGVTLDHCQSVSRQVSALLDVYDFGPKRYYLEVSSPGLDRELFEARDYARFNGQLARVTFTNAEDKKQTIVGRIEGLEGQAQDADDDLAGENADAEPDSPGGAIVIVRDEAAEATYKIPHSSIRTARLEIEI